MCVCREQTKKYYKKITFYILGISFRERTELTSQMSIEKQDASIDSQKNCEGLKSQIAFRMNTLFVNKML